MASLITVAIPVKNGGALLERTLRAVADQRLPPGFELQLMVCDSGSSDGSVALCRRYGAEVFEIPAAEFSHGGTRNRLMERSRGAYVAFLTQDAAPASETWLATLCSGFEAAPEVALCFGPYRPNPGASPWVASGLDAWFAGFGTGSPDAIAVDRLSSGAGVQAELLGRTGFFSDANGAVRRAAWEQVPFREIAYAEDRALALDMLRAGYAKAYVPAAAVLHSHEYRPLEQLRRSFDEARALHDVYGWAEPAGIRRGALKIWGSVGADDRSAGLRGGARLGVLVGSTLHHSAALSGALLGARAERLPASLRRVLSLERRAH